ncbi:MAG: hypothetical protein ACRD0K_22155 [Egibacteraceae bacterium]
MTWRARMIGWQLQGGWRVYRWSLTSTRIDCGRDDDAADRPGCVDDDGHGGWPAVWAADPRRRVADLVGEFRGPDAVEAAGVGRQRGEPVGEDAQVGVGDVEAAEGLLGGGGVVGVAMPVGGAVLGAVGEVVGV